MIDIQGDNSGTTIGGDNYGPVAVGNSVAITQLQLTPDPQRPAEPPPLFTRTSTIERTEAVDDLRRLLTRHRCVMISGPSGRGKTTLAAQYLLRYGVEASYPCGVLWVDIDQELDVQAVLRRWARWYYGGTEPLLRDRGRAIVITMDDVRTMLAHREGHLLVVFDNLQPEFVPVIEPLIQVLPAQTDIILTGPERLQLQDGRGPVTPYSYAVPPISEREADQLIKLFDLARAPIDLLRRLVQQLKDDFQSLRAEFGTIQAFEPADQDTAIRRRLGLSVAAKEQAVPAPAPPLPRAANSIEFCYQELGQIAGVDAKHCLRMLGISGPLGADMSREMAAAQWGLAADEPAVDEIFREFESRSLLRPTTTNRWVVPQQVREFAIAQLRANSEQEIADTRYKAYIIELLVRLFESGLEEWPQFEPDRPHLFFVGKGLVREARELLGPVDYFEDQLPDVNAFDEQTQTQLGHALEFVVYAAITYLNHQQLVGVTETALLTGLCIARISGYYKLEWTLLLSGTRYHSKRGDLFLSQRLALRAIEVAEANNDEQATLWASFQAGIASASLHQYERAEQFFRRALTLLPPESELYRIQFTNELADLAIVQEYFDQAVHLLEPWVTTIREAAQGEAGSADHVALAVRTIDTLGTAVALSGELARAEELFREANALAAQASPELLIQVRLNRAGVYHVLGRNDIALESLGEALDDARRANTPQLQADILVRIGMNRFHNGIVPEAREALEQALHILKDTLDNKPLLCDTLTELGRVDAKLSKIDSAIRCLGEAIDLAVEIDERRSIIKVIEILMGIYQESGRIHEGLRFFEHLLQRVQGAPTVQMSIFGSMAILALAAGDLHRAFMCFEQIPERLDVTHIVDLEERLIALYMLGMVSIMRGQTADGTEYLAEAVKTAKRVRESHIQAVSLKILGVVALRTSNTAQAGEHIRDLEALAERDSSEVVQLHLLDLRGQHLLAAQKFTDGIEALKSGLALARKTDNPILVVTFNLNLASAYMLSDQTDLAERTLDAVIREARALGSLNLAVTGQVYKGLVLAYGRNQHDQGIVLVEQGIQEMERASIGVLADGMTPEFVRVLLQSMRDQAARGASPRPVEDLLRVVLRATNWKVAEVATHTGRQTLMQRELLSALNIEIETAKRRNRPDIAEILVVYQQVLGWCQSENISGAYQRASEQFEKEIIYRWWGQIHRVQREYSAALLKLNRAVELAPQSALAYIERGWVYRGLGQYEQAIDDFQRALKHDSQSARANLGLGVVCLELNQLSQALRYIERAVLLEPNYAYHYHWRAAAYQALGDLTHALSDLAQARQRDPDDTAHAYWHALVQLEAANTETALEEFEILAEQEVGRLHDLVYTQIWRGYTLHLLGRQAEAIDVWTTARAEIEELPEGMLRSLALAFADAARGSIDQSIQHYKRVMREPHPPHLLKTHLGHLRMMERLEHHGPERQTLIVQLEGSLDRVP
jgi:tetratricopeptide (TPR) repeat protein